MIYDLCTYHPSNLLIAAARDKLVKLYDTRTTKCVKTLRGHQNTVSCIITSSNTKQVGPFKLKFVSFSFHGTLESVDPLRNDLVML